MIICVEQGANLHMSQPMPLPLTVSCFSKIQIGFTFGTGWNGCVRVCVIDVIIISTSPVLLVSAVSLKRIWNWFGFHQIKHSSRRVVCASLQLIVCSRWSQRHNVPVGCGALRPGVVWVAPGSITARCTAMYNCCQLPWQALRLWRRISHRDRQHCVQVTVQNSTVLSIGQVAWWNQGSSCTLGDFYLFA